MHQRNKHRTDILNRSFVSDIDQTLQAFNQTQPLSESQRAERKKYERIFSLRDNIDTASTDDTDPLFDD